MRFTRVLTTVVASTLILPIAPPARSSANSRVTNGRPSSFQRAGLPTSVLTESKIAIKQPTSTKAKEAYGLLPLSFEANEGQTDRQVRFLARGQGYNLFLTPTGAVLSLNRASREKPTVLSMHLVGSQPSPRIHGADMLPGKHNYFIGNDSKKWRTGISTYSKVRYGNAYPGIDVVYYGNQQQLEYDFVLAPGADPNRIKLAFKGASGIRVEPNGDLVLNTARGEVRQQKPLAYQEIAGTRREISASYRVKENRISFQVAKYDKKVPLIIDPVLIYSSFLGGANFERGLAIAVDNQGNAYLTGDTGSPDFPLAGAIQNTRDVPNDAFVVKVNPTGTALVYSTYLGGNSNDNGFAIAVDGQGRAYVAGSTSSDTFPTTTGALQESKDIWIDGFIAKLNPAGSALEYSTFLGGDNIDRVFGIAVGVDGRAVVGGTTESSRFRTFPFATPRPGSAASKSVNGAGNWATIGSGLTANGVNAFALDPTNSNILYAATNIGVFKTVDAGANWTPTGGTSSPTTLLTANAVVIDPSNPAVVYAGAETGVYKSTNGGTLFEQKNDGLTDPFVNALAIDAATPMTLYAGTAFGIFKSTNGGGNWTGINNGLDFNVPIVTEIVIDPTNSSVIYIGTSDGMFKTTNGGALWNSINTGILVGNPNDISALAIDPLNPATLYAGVLANPPVVVKTTNAGTTWTASDTGMGPEVFNVNSLAVDPTTPATLYAATTSSGIFKSTNGGANWNQSNSGLANLRTNAVTVDRNSLATVYVGSSILSDAFAARLNPSGSTLEYLKNFGGNEGEHVRSVALDDLGNAYLVGTTVSQNFPMVNAVQPAFGGFEDAFVAKLNNLGTQFIYSTYLGGINGEEGRAIAVHNGCAYVVGTTFSPNFPVVSAVQTNLAGFGDAFVTKLNPAGAALSFSTYLGGSLLDQGLGVSVDPSGAAFVTGATGSLDFPTMDAPQSTFGGNSLDGFVTRLNSPGSALVYSTYLGGSGVDQGNGIAVDAQGNAYVIGTTSSNNFPTANPFQPTRRSNDAFFTKLSAATSVQFLQSNHVVGENGVSIDVNVSRTGDTSGPAKVSYSTNDTAGVTCNTAGGIASSKCDYTSSIGTLNFAAGDTSKSITVLISDDAYAEGNETFTIGLSNAAGASLGTPSTASVTISDNDAVNGANPLDEPSFFVRQHYHDFLNREPDAAGLAFWTSEITSCGSDPQCIEIKRINVSAAFFLSIEFQETGYLVYRMYKAAYGDTTSPNVAIPVPIIRLNEFLPDAQRVGDGFRVGIGDWQAQLEANKTAYAREFVMRPRFLADYPLSMSATEFVDKLNLNSGGVLSQAERDQLIGELTAAPDVTTGRASVLRKVAEDADMATQERNRAFVLMQYYGYMRRNPDDPQDADFRGWEFWLNKLNQFNGNFVDAEMVKAFIVSIEYRQRFGP